MMPHSSSAITTVSICLKRRTKNFDFLLARLVHCSRPLRVQPLLKSTSRAKFNLHYDSHPLLSICSPAFGSFPCFLRTFHWYCVARYLLPLPRCERDEGLITSIIVVPWVHGLEYGSFISSYLSLCDGIETTWSVWLAWLTFSNFLFST